jgi:hypothetical protein
MFVSAVQGAGPRVQKYAEWMDKTYGTGVHSVSASKDDGDDWSITFSVGETLLLILEIFDRERFGSWQASLTITHPPSSDGRSAYMHRPADMPALDAIESLWRYIGDPNDSGGMEFDLFG